MGKSFTERSGVVCQSILLGRGASQSDPISAILFILTLVILSLLIKSKPDIEGMTIFEHNYLYSAYTDGKTFFLFPFSRRILSLTSLTTKH